MKFLQNPINGILNFGHVSNQLSEKSEPLICEGSSSLKMVRNGDLRQSHFVDKQTFRNDLCNNHARIKATEGILKNNLHFFSQFKIIFLPGFFIEEFYFTT